MKLINVIKSTISQNVCDACKHVCIPQTTDKASIQRLTESFVTKLQADFPSTVSTIYRSVATSTHLKLLFTG